VRIARTICCPTRLWRLWTSQRWFGPKWSCGDQVAAVRICGRIACEGPPVQRPSQPRADRRRRRRRRVCCSDHLSLSPHRCARPLAARRGVGRRVAGQCHGLQRLSGGATPTPAMDGVRRTLPRLSAPPQFPPISSPNTGAYSIQFVVRVTSDSCGTPCENRLRHVFSHGRQRQTPLLVFGTVRACVLPPVSRVPCPVSRVPCPVSFACSLVLGSPIRCSSLPCALCTVSSN